MKNEDYLSHYNNELVRSYKNSVDNIYRKKHGQYFTSPSIAKFMSHLIDIPSRSIRILDPGAGTGILSASIIDEIVRNKKDVKEVILDAYESDKEIIPYLEDTLNKCKTIMEREHYQFTYNIFNEDVILKNAHNVKRRLDIIEKNEHRYDIIISNPPYFKIRKNSVQAKVLDNIIVGQPNIYFLFMAVSAALLKEQGQMVFIVPRSFCSGLYYGKFRKWLIKQVNFSSIHLFSSRKNVFSSEEVLQENIIIKVVKAEEKNIKITTCEDDTFTDMKQLIVNKSDVIFWRNGDVFFRIPASEMDLEVIRELDKLQYHFKKLGIKISTGPIVPFRTKNNLSNKDDKETVPLVWMHNFRGNSIVWPIFKSNSPISIKNNPETRSMLVKKSNYVLTKRFSSKEQKRRIHAAVLLKKEFGNYNYIGVENRVNYIYKNVGELSSNEAIGLTYFLNMTIVDLYFRILNGHTQVNANEIYALPMPSLRQIENIGKIVSSSKLPKQKLELDVAKSLDIDVSLYNRIYKRVNKMNKIKEMIYILKEIHVPKKQQNDRSALTILSLVGVTEKQPWYEAKLNYLRIHDIMQFIQENYNITYAENSRETFRRQTLHQFEQEGLVERNADEPRPTNSPNTVWSIHPDALELLKCFNTERWVHELKVYLEKKGKNLERYNEKKKKRMLTFSIDGKDLSFSYGKHNKLQIDILDSFRDNFSNDSEIVYVGDTAQKMLYFNDSLANDLRIPITKHDKLPDVVLYEKAKHRLFLIEAVTSHGPISIKRQTELEDFLKTSDAKRIYVSAFPNFSLFKKNINDIAWETEVWIAEFPEHMIHFNGDKFLSVNTQNTPKDGEMTE